MNSAHPRSHRTDLDLTEIHLGDYHPGDGDLVRSDYYRTACGWLNGDKPYGLKLTQNLAEATCLDCIRAKRREGLKLAREARKRLKEIGA